MNKTSTQKELLRYAYNETDLSDSDRIQKSIDGDPLVQQDYNEIHDVMIVRQLRILAKDRAVVRFR